MPCDISKAERGYRLFDADSYSLSLPAPTLNPEMPLDDAYSALAWHLLGSSQRLAEQYRFNGHWRLLQDWVALLSELRALTGSLGQAAPRTSTHEMRESLDALLEDWRPLVQAGQEDPDVRNAAHEQFIEELLDPRWGLFSLNTSRWLMARTWTADRNTRGNRKVLRSWLTGCHVFWPKKRLHCNWAAINSNRKTWQNSYRALNAFKPGCTWLVVRWTCLS